MADGFESDDDHRFENHVVRLRIREAALEEELEAQNAELAARARRIQLLEARLAAWQERPIRTIEEATVELEARELLIRELEEATNKAFRSLEAAYAVSGDGDTTAQHACDLLNAPDAQSAAQAHMILAEAVLGMSERPFVQGMFKEAQRDCRDVLVLRCRCRARPGDRRAFLEAAKDAFGVQQLGTELKAVMLLAYHKLAKKSQAVDTFLSNNQRATAARGGRPRPRRGPRGLRPNTG